MESADIDKVKHLSNTEVIRRLLVKYFIDKGFAESFDRQLFPCLIQDLPLIIPVLADKVEIVPYAESVDPNMGRARIGWNMFVLGSHRMYLGETLHNDLNSLARQIQSGMFTLEESLIARKQTTPKRVVSFLTRVLGDHDAGFVDLRPSTSRGQPGEPFGSRAVLSGNPGGMFNRSGYGT
jgi:hypothetical protein